MTEAQNAELEAPKNLIETMDTEACTEVVKGLALGMQNLDIYELATGREGDDKRFMNAMSTVFIVLADRAMDAHCEDRRKHKESHENELARFVPAAVLQAVAKLEDKGIPVMTNMLAFDLKLPADFLQPMLENMVKEGTLVSSSWGLMRPETAMKIKAATARHAATERTARTKRARRRS